MRGVRRIGNNHGESFKVEKESWRGRMKDWDTDKIIGAGLILALLVIIFTDLVISLDTSTIPSRELAGNIVSGLIGYMGRSLVEKLKKETEMKGGIKNDSSEHKGE